jgi:type I restriction enzyme S subunit
VKLFKLGTVAEVIAGQSPEGIFYNSNGDGTPFYQGKKEFGDRFLGPPTTWTTKVTKLAQAGDILMSVRAPVGPINFSTQQICIGRGLASIRASELVDKNFLFYFLLHKQPEISGNTGAVFDSINKEQIASIEIPVPSLEKQREIVNKLDTVFTEIDTLIKEAELSRRLLRQIYEQEIERVFQRNTNGWPSTTIEESCDYKNGKAHEQLVNPAGNYRLVTSKFVSSNGKLARRVTTALTPLLSGDVAFVLSDLPNGKALAKAYLVENEEDLTLNQRVLRVKSSKFIPKFLYLQINRHPYLLSFDNGESQTHLKLAQVLSCPLLIPDLKIQKQTSERLIGLRSEVEHSEETLNQKVLMLNALRQSFLFQAFDYSEPAEAVA